MEATVKFKVGDRAYVDNPTATEEGWIRTYDNKNGPFILIEKPYNWHTNVTNGMYVVREDCLIHEHIFNSPLMRALT